MEKTAKKSSMEEKGKGFLAYIKSGKLTPLFINILLLFFLLLFFIPAEKTDDFNEKSILSGAFSGETSAHLLYSYYFYGGGLKLLQELLPGIAWYEVIQYVLLFISFTIITYLVWNKRDKKYSLLILLPVLLYFGYDSYIKLTFTKTAGIVIASGFFMLFHELRRKRSKKLKLALAVFMIILGSMIRCSSSIFSAACVFFFIYAAYDVFVDYLYNRLDKKKIIKYLSFLVSLVIVVTVIRKVDRIVYCQSPEWKDYWDYNHYKAELQDYGWPDYEENKEQFEALGVSDNDYLMWSEERNYSDPNIYNTYLMERIIDIKDKPGFYDKFIKNISPFFKEYPIKFVQNTGFLIIICLIMILSLSLAKEKKVLSILGILVPLGLEYYLFCNNRYGRDHVDLVIMFSTSLLLLNGLKFARLNKRSIAKAFLIGMGIFILDKDYKYMTVNTYYGKAFTIEQEEAREVLDRISEDKANLYVVSYSEYSGILRGYDSFETIEPGSLSNLFILTGYMYPSHRAVLDNYGIDNIYKHLCDDNVYYVTTANKSDINVILTYVKEHYNPSAKYEIIETDGKVKYVKFVNKSK